VSEVIELTSAERVREFYRKQGELREQQRIIKLITANCNDGLGEDLVPGGCEHDVIIALIKGENK